MRHIILDTETTGIGAESGHRIIEIACVEMVSRKLTGNHYHVYLNPERQVDEGAFRVHGISTEFLQDKPFFKDIANEFLQFIDGSELIIHNAPFDVGFLNAELKRVSWPKLLPEYCTIFDTLPLAREKHPGQRNTLDALCKRYAVDNSERQLHGALLDAELLALVYLAMTGGQAKLFIEEELSITKAQTNTISRVKTLKSHSPVYVAEGDELVKHDDFVQFLVKKSGVNYWED